MTSRRASLNNNNIIGIIDLRYTSGVSRFETQARRLGLETKYVVRFQKDGITLKTGGGVFSAMPSQAALRAFRRNHGRDVKPGDQIIGTLVAGREPGNYARFTRFSPMS